MSADKQPGHLIRGRPFEKGNGGRKRGSQNLTIKGASALLHGQAADIVENGIALARQGNVPMLKLFVERLLL